MKKLILLIALLTPFATFAHHGHDQNHTNEHITMSIILGLSVLLILVFAKPVRKLILKTVKNRR